MISKLIIALALLGQLASAEVFYIANSGKDANPGSESQPWASLAGAVAHLEDLDGPDSHTVYIDDGIYYLDKTIMLGATAADITFKAKNRHQVRFHGGRILKSSDFQPVNDKAIIARLDPKAKSQVLMLDLAASFPGLILAKDWPGAFRGYAGWPELFIDNEPLTMARWPNDNFAKIAKVIEKGSSSSDADKTKRPGSFQYAGDRPQRWKAAGEIYLNGYWCHKWYDEALLVESINYADKVIKLAAPHHYGIGGHAGGLYYAFNLIEEIDSPGEYAIDRANGKIYCWLPDDFGQKEISISALNQPMLDINGAKNINFSGIIFECSTTLIASIKDCHQIIIKDCIIRNSGKNAVVIANGKDNCVDSCEIYNMGSGGISLSGGKRQSLTACNNSANNNHIHHFARNVMTYQSAVQLSGVGCVASHNEIHDAPHMAIGFGGNDHLIEYNHIHHVCLNTADAGAIYTGRDWTVRGTVIKFNYFHHLGASQYFGNYAVYLDDMACGTRVFGNIIADTSSAMLIGGGRDNVIDNNIMIRCRESIRIDARALGWAKFHVEKPNGTMWQRLNAMPYQSKPWADKYPNLVKIAEDQPAWPKYNVLRNNALLGSPDFNLAKEVRQTGTIDNNFKSDKVDAFIQQKGDGSFVLAPDSPLFGEIKGFKAIAIDEIGQIR
ncbi:MAG: right-handed parallel beta-helix repeat-containing protein [Phycisphaerae bacterium]|nr:right-handed parallel beta-helix repeat-containing protein [Phycisphaerae bacterium]